MGVRYPEQSEPTLHPALAFFRHQLDMAFANRRPDPVPDVDPDTCSCREAMLELADAAHSRRLGDAQQWLDVGCRVCGKEANVVTGTVSLSV